MDRSQRGVSLIEALVALLVLGFGMMALVKFDATLANTGALAKQRTEATMLGQRRIEELRAFIDAATYDAYFASGNPVTRTSTVNGENASYAISAKLTDVNQAVGGRYAAVEVQIDWTDQKGESHAVNLVSRFARLQVANSGAVLVTAGSTPPPTAICPSQSASWSVNGLACTGLIATGGSLGQTALVNATSNQGTNQYVCQQDGSWAAVASYPKTCTAACPSQSASWTGTAGASCTATLPLAYEGATADVADATAPVTGNARYACANGVWSITAQPAPTCIATCPSGVHTWDTLLYEDVNKCQTTLPAGTAPQTQAIDNSVQGVLSATASYTCSSLGAWTRTLSSCLFTAPLPGYCRADSASWVVGTESCTGLRPQTASGQSYTVQITQGAHLGEATYSCASGSWSATPTNASCRSNCFIRVSGSIASSAASVHVNGVAAGCTVSNKTYLCSSLAVTEGGNTSIQAFKSNGDAAGTVKTIPNSVCGQSYTLAL